MDKNTSDDSQGQCYGQGLMSSGQTGWSEVSSGRRPGPLDQ